ncbi:MAG: chemotaxis protein CheW [Rubrivivax sp.]|nr:chemotaxis protein CheW [Rubrivivax sp.]
MAQRDALRELQARLAERLQAVRTEARQASWLAVECAGHGLLFPLAGAGEIFACGTVVAVPHTQAWFVGVASLRGELHGVVDLAAFLGLRAPRLPADAARDQARLLALNASLGSHCALLVDRLAGLRGAEALTPEAPGDTARPRFARAVWRDAEGRRWEEIDLAALAAHEQFLAIAA